jgi:hypothetical protein
MDFQELYDQAREAGLVAVAAEKVQPMIVGQSKSIFNDEIDDTKPTYFVEGGLCGFAEVVVKPGNSKFANWLKKNKLADTRYYGGGVSVWVSEFGQSYQRKMAYAAAFAKVLRDKNIRASATGRLD